MTLFNAVEVLVHVIQYWPVSESLQTVYKCSTRPIWNCCLLWKKRVSHSSALYAHVIYKNSRTQTTNYSHNRVLTSPYLLLWHIWDGHVVTKLNRLVSSSYSRFPPPHGDNTNSESSVCKNNLLFLLVFYQFKLIKFIFLMTHVGSCSNEIRVFFLNWVLFQRTIKASGIQFISEYLPTCSNKDFKQCTS